MSRAADSAILERADRDGRVVIAEDTDFGGLLILSGRASPSVILFRDRSGKTTTRSRLLLANLPQPEADLRAGSIVVIDEMSVRVRRLRGEDRIK